MTMGLLLACLAVSLAAVLYPMYVIRPFRAQGARELAAALIVIRWRPWITALAAIAGVAALAGYWGAQRRGWLRALAVAMAAGIGVLAYVGRVNIFEVMFHPIERPAFAAAGRSKLDPDEKVLAVQLGGAARAYPVRSISYHHVVNDVVSGVPIVATY
jgi:hypothetical protein